MSADDVRWLAQRVVAKAFHSVSDASVEALARRVLELEGAVAAEREACAKLCEAQASELRNQKNGSAYRLYQQAESLESVTAAIRARGGK